MASIMPGEELVMLGDKVSGGMVLAWFANYVACTAPKLRKLEGDHGKSMKNKINVNIE